MTSSGSRRNWIDVLKSMISPPCYVIIPTRKNWFACWLMKIISPYFPQVHIFLFFPRFPGQTGLASLTTSLTQGFLTLSVFAELPDPSFLWNRSLDWLFPVTLDLNFSFQTLYNMVVSNLAESYFTTHSQYIPAPKWV